MFYAVQKYAFYWSFAAKCAAIYYLALLIWNCEIALLLLLLKTCWVVSDGCI